MEWWCGRGRRTSGLIIRGCSPCMVSPRVDRPSVPCAHLAPSPRLHHQASTAGHAREAREVAFVAAASLPPSLAAPCRRSTWTNDAAPSESLLRRLRPQPVLRASPPPWTLPPPNRFWPLHKLQRLEGSPHRRALHGELPAPSMPSRHSTCRLRACCSAGQKTAGAPPPCSCSAEAVHRRCPGASCCQASIPAPSAVWKLYKLRRQGAVVKTSLMSLAKPWTNSPNAFEMAEEASVAAA